MLIYLLYFSYKVRKERYKPMVVTVAQLEELECGWVDLMREVGLDDITIATNLGYTLIENN